MDSRILLAIPIVLAVLLASGCTEMFPTGKVVAPGTATLYGRLTDKATGLPIAGEPVRVGELLTVTDREGGYEITGITPGAYTVVWGGIDYYRIESPELLSEGQAMERDILLSRKKE